MKRFVFVFLAFLGGASTLFADLIVSRGTFGVDRYTDTGVFLGNVIAPGSGGLSDAQGVAITPSGGYLVGDFTNDGILRFAPDGSFINVFASGPAIKTPFDVVTGPGGDIFVANAGGLNTVARLNPVTGAVIAPNFITDDAMHPTGGPQYLEFGPELAMTDRWPLVPVRRGYGRAHFHAPARQSGGGRLRLERRLVRCTADLQ